MKLLKTIQAILYAFKKTVKFAIEYRRVLKNVD